MADEMRDLVIEDCHDKMRKAVEHLKVEFGAIRTGRATPGVVEKLAVDYYGSMTPLQQLAGFSVPEPLKPPQERGIRTTRLDGLPAHVHQSLFDKELRPRAKASIRLGQPSDQCVAFKSESLAANIVERGEKLRSVFFAVVIEVASAFDKFHQQHLRARMEHLGYGQ